LAWLCLTCLLGVTSARADDFAARHRPPVFALDPVFDTTLLAGTLTLSVTSEAIISTGEIEAQLPDSETELLGIDAWVAKRDSASLRRQQTSDVGVLALMVWAVADTALAGFGLYPDSALTYATLYLESAFTAWSVGNLFKMAVRRPRPRAYIELRETGSVSEGTQEALSFYSGHTAIVATLGATATYIAFTRGGPAWLKWLIFGGSVFATGVVGVGRMLSGAHFTTDVLAGLGAGVVSGVLIPHLHRISHFQPVITADGSGGTLGIAGTL
jgi:undecaprenyl-diphosphatase